MSQVRLIHGEYYWLRAKPDDGIYKIVGGDLMIGQYNTNWKTPMFDICGKENPFFVESFDILAQAIYEDN